MATVELESDLRSLFSGKSLKYNLGVAIDAQIVNGLGIWRAAGAVCSTRELAQNCRARRPKLSREGLHLERCGDCYLRMKSRAKENVKYNGRLQCGGMGEEEDRG